MLHTGMPLEMRTDVAERSQILLGEEASLCQGCVKSRSCMALGKYETVSVCLLRVLRIDIQLFKIQICKNICC